jgi:hypothetical protein
LTRDRAIEQAEAYAARAFQAFASANYDEAVALYLRAYETVPSADILFNLARVHDVGLRDRGLAISFYESYILAADAEPDNVALARERIERLRATEATEPVGVEPAQTTADTSEPAALLGHTPVGAEASSAAEPASVSPTGVSPSVSPPSMSKATAWTPWRVGAFVAGGVGVLGMGLGAGFGVAALSDAATARKDCDGDVCASRRGVDATRSARDNANLATLGFAIGGSLLAAGLTMLWIAPDGSRTENALASLEWSPVASTSELGLAMTGKW